MQDNVYRELFLTESAEYLKLISQCLVTLEEKPSDSSSLNEVFRCIHTIKGMSATMGFDKISQLSHATENLLDELRNKKIKVTSKIIDRLFACLDMLEGLIEEVRLEQPSKIDIMPYLSDLKRFLSPEGIEEIFPEPSFEALEFSEPERQKFKQMSEEGANILQIKITLDADCVMKQARAVMVLMDLARLGEVVKSLPNVDDLEQGRFGASFIVVLISKEKIEIIRQELSNILEVQGVEIILLEISFTTPIQAEKYAAASYVKKIQSMRISVERLDKIMNLVGELTIAKIRLLEISKSYKLKPLDEIVFFVGRLTSSLQDEITQTRLLPIAYILDTFPRMVRDLAKKDNKEIDFQIIGSEIELDRVILDEISNPLMHLLRNAVDHGIEPPEERKRLKKDLRGKISIKVSRERGQIFITVSDDGRGIDFEAVKRQARIKVLLSDEEAAQLDQKGILDLLTLPGFSTSEKVTEVSGRGVGLDVVKSRIEALGGRLDFETQPRGGSQFVLTLPLTVAIIKAMLVKVQDETYAIPLMNIRETIKAGEDEIKLIQNFEVIKVRDEIIPILRLDEELGLEGQTFKEGKIPIVIIEVGNKGVGLIVTKVLGEQDIVVKPLGTIVKKNKGIAGATILGDGNVALILDVMGLGGGVDGRSKINR